MRIILLSLIAGCVSPPTIVEEESRLLIGGPGLEEESTTYMGINSTTHTTHSVPIASSDVADTPSVFLPDELDFDKPVRPEVEEVVKSIPVLSAEQTALGWYSINGLAIANDGAIGMLGMSGGNSCEYNPSGGYLSGADFTNQSCPDVPVEYDDEGRVMYLCGEDIGFWSPGWGDQHYTVPGLVGVKVTSKGFVTVESNDGCHVSRRDHDALIESVEVPSVLCDTMSEIVVNEDDDIVYVANGDIYAVNDVGYRIIAENSGDLIAFDGVHNTIVSAWSMSETLGAMNPRGELLWKASTPGVIHDLESVGDQGAVFALVYEDIALPGSFIAYDGEWGEVWGDFIAWNGILDFSVAKDASKVLVTTGESIYTYDVTIEEPQEDE